MRRHLR